MHKCTCFRFLRAHRTFAREIEMLLANDLLLHIGPRLVKTAVIRLYVDHLEILVPRDSQLYTEDVGRSTASARTLSRSVRVQPSRPCNVVTCSFDFCFSSLDCVPHLTLAPRSAQRCTMTVPIRAQLIDAPAPVCACLSLQPLPIAMRSTRFAMRPSPLAEPSRVGPKAHAVRRMRCVPLSVCTTSESWPTLSAKAASSNGFCICPRVKKPRSPPLRDEEQSLFVVDKTWRGRKGKGGEQGYEARA